MTLTLCQSTPLTTALSNVLKILAEYDRWAQNQFNHFVTTAEYPAIQLRTSVQSAGYPAAVRLRTVVQR